MRINDTITRQAPRMYSGLMSTRIGVIDGRASTAVIRNDIHHMSAPSCNHAGAGRSSRKLQPIRRQKQVADRIAKNFDADAAAAEQPPWAAIGMRLQLPIIIGVRAMAPGPGIGLDNHQP